MESCTGARHPCAAPQTLCMDCAGLPVPWALRSPTATPGAFAAVGLRCIQQGSTPHARCSESRNAHRSNLVIVGVLQLGLAVLLGIRDVLAQRLLRQDVRIRVRRRLRLRHSKATRHSNARTKFWVLYADKGLLRAHSAVLCARASRIWVLAIQGRHATRSSGMLANGVALRRACTGSSATSADVARSAPRYAALATLLR